MGKRVKELLILAGVAVGSVVLVWWVAGTLRIYENFDGPYYVVVAKSFYDKAYIQQHFSFPLPVEYYAAHLPLYPAAIKLVTLTGLNFLQGMLAVNVLFGVAAAAVLYLMAAEFKWGNPFWITFAWLFMWPRMWAVRSVGSPETLFMFLALVSIWCFIKKKYLISGLLAGLTFLTKSPGILLFAGYGLWWLVEGIKYKKWEWKCWPVVLGLVAVPTLFWLYQFRMQDVWAYFHSGDNIHLLPYPFGVFDSTKAWVGQWWLEDILWVYLVGGLGVWYAWKKNRVLAAVGTVFFVMILFVAHRDISRYSLPIIPAVVVGLSGLFEKKEVRVAMVVVLVPMLFYTLNFIANNLTLITNWAPLL